MSAGKAFRPTTPTMKAKYKSSNESAAPSVQIHSKLVKLFLGVVAACVGFASPFSASGQTVDPGDGTLPPERPEMFMKVAAPPKKITDLVNLTSKSLTTGQPSIKNKQSVELSVQVIYLDKKGKWQPLSYTSMPVDFKIGRGLGYLRVKTDKNGYAKVRVQINAKHVPSSGMWVNWQASFPGDEELRNKTKSSKFWLAR